MKHLKISLLLLLSTVVAQSQEQFVINSNYLVSPDTVWVFTPDDIDNKSLPLTYLLHGWSGNYQNWNEIIDCQKYANEYNTIIVCPDGLYDSWYINSPAENENDWATFFSWELAPLIAQNYNIQEDSIFITGLSMGGHGALYLFGLFTEYFQSAGSQSGLLDLRNWSEHYGINRILGLSDDEEEDNEDILWSYSVAAHTDWIKSKNKKIIVSCGTEDPFYNINVDYVDLCKENEIDVTFISGKGAHNGNYWHSAVKDHFEFFFK